MNAAHAISDANSAKAESADADTKEVKSNTGKGTLNPKVKESIEKGNRAHTDFKQKADQKGWETNPRLNDPQTAETVNLN